MTTKLRIVDLFSGIGSQVAALRNIGFNVEVTATCEWDIQTFVAYDYRIYLSVLILINFSKK